jgi:hypothetical protein
VSLEDKILIVANDAGGAEVLSAWVKKFYGPQYIFYLEGPAVSIFLKKLPQIKLCSEKEMWDLISCKKLTSIMTATSYENLERKVIQKSKKAGIKVLTLLDHWMNLKERFGLPDEEWELSLPDEIWCGDKYVLQMCLDLKFPKEILKLVPNYYWEEIKHSSASSSVSCKPNGVLYLAEPIGEYSEAMFGDRFYTGYDEFTCMEYFFQTLINNSAKNLIITIRKHPREPENKYDELIEKYSSKFKIKISEQVSLLEDCLSNTYIVGVETMGLVIGMLLDKKVFTSIPPGGRKCVIPFTEIQSISFFRF